MESKDHWNEESSDRVRFTVSYQGIKAFLNWLKKKKEKPKEEDK